MVKTKKQQVEKLTIKKYWEKNAPQIWYSDKEQLSIEWFNEIEYKRYNLYLECFNEMFEYEYHYKEKICPKKQSIGLFSFTSDMNNIILEGIQWLNDLHLNYNQWNILPKPSVKELYPNI